MFTLPKRITPAYTGKSLEAYHQATGDKDHPRIHGEKFQQEPGSVVSQGSPPHTRGKADGKVACGAVGRITPAYTGKSIMCRPASQHNLDHPRIHGEKPRSETRRACGTGSPPHTRGKVKNRYRKDIALRITPAYTGKSATSHFFTSNHSGSPPHTRGKAIRHNTNRVEDRITPAYTGKSYHMGCEKICVQDHPRIHGEKSDVRSSRNVMSGSPPHTRGKVQSNSKIAQNLGITPAYTGKSRI